MNKISTRRTKNNLSSNKKFNCFEPQIKFRPINDYQKTRTAKKKTLVMKKEICGSCAKQIEIEGLWKIMIWKKKKRKRNLVCPTKPN